MHWKRGVSLLVITRKNGESILIGDDIEITVSKVEDGSVKLAINAPKEMTILRKELFEEVENQNKEATKVNIELIKMLEKNKMKKWKAIWNIFQIAWKNKWNNSALLNYNRISFILSFFNSFIFPV